jgi:hypothetical protein
MRSQLLVLCVFMLTIAGCIASDEHPTARQYKNAMINKEAGVRAAGHAAIGTLTNSPHEWGRGPIGFAKRAGSGLGQHAVKGTIQLGVGAWHHENLHYQRSNLQGNWPRLKYAVKSTFIVPRTGNRKGKTVALGRVAGNMGGGLVSRVWQPASTAGVGAGLASGGIGLGADVGMNVAREFWPQKRHGRQLRRRAEWKHS